MSILTQMIIYSRVELKNLLMTLSNFIKDYINEESCKSKFKQYIEHVGIVCPKCGKTEHFWKQRMNCYEFKYCKHRQGLRSNIVMHNVVIINKIL